MAGGAFFIWRFDYERYRNHESHGVYFKEEPIRELHRALERLDFRIVYPNDREDLLKLIENNARLCGVIFDWDKYNLELCEDISKMNEYMPLYAFANTTQRWT